VPIRVETAGFVGMLVLAPGGPSVRFFRVVAHALPPGAAGRDRERFGMRMSVQPRALEDRPLGTLNFQHIKGEQVP
jgi:hypothetical protein